MELTDKKTKAQVITASSIYLLLIICGIVFASLRGLTDLPPKYVINIGVDIFGMIMGYVLLISCVIYVQKTGSDQRYFLRLLTVAFFGLFTDLVAWLVDGIASLRVINILDNTGCLRLSSRPSTDSSSAHSWRTRSKALSISSRLFGSQSPVCGA